MEEGWIRKLQRVSNTLRLVMGKKPLMLLMLAAWLVSSGLMLLSTKPATTSTARAAGEMTISTTAKPPNSVDILFSKFPGNKAAKYSLKRLPVPNTNPDPSSAPDITSIPANPAIETDPTKSSYTYTDTNVPVGSWNYAVIAYDSGSTSLGIASTNTAVTITSTAASGGTNPTTSPTASEFLNSGCAPSVQAAQTAAAHPPPTQGIYDTIAGDGVKQVFRWTLSLVNLFVLFFLLVIAFANILRVNVDTYSLQKVFTLLVLGVLLANFSWLICRFFIEISTILYHALTDPFINTAATGATSGGAGLFRAIAEQGYGFNQICSIAKGGTGSLSIGSGLLGSFVGTALIVVAAVLILTLYVLLVARVWIVTLLMILSPLAFLSLGFPMTQQYFKKWWTMFFNWVFMAPASFLVLVLAYQMTKISTEPSLTKFIIITALLYFAVQVPFKMGGEWMTKWGGYVSQFKQKAYEKTGKPIGARIGQSYQGYKDEAKTMGKTALSRIPLWSRDADGRRRNIGAKLGEMKENTRIRRLRRTTELENVVTGRGAGTYNESEHGKRAQQKLGQQTQAKQESEDTVKLATQKGVLDFQQSGSDEAKRIRERLARINREQTLYTEELHHIAEDDIKKFRQTGAGAHIDAELAKLGREKTLLEEELKKLDSAALAAFQATKEGTKINVDIAKLQRQNLEIEKRVGQQQKTAELRFTRTKEGREITKRLKKLGLEETAIQDMIDASQAKQELTFVESAEGKKTVQRMVLAGWRKEGAQNWLKSAETKIAQEYAGRNDNITDKNTIAEKAVRDLEHSVLEAKTQDDELARARIRAQASARNLYIYEKDENGNYKHQKAIDSFEKFQLKRQKRDKIIKAKEATQARLNNITGYKENKNELKEIKEKHKAAMNAQVNDKLRELKITNPNMSQDELVANIKRFEAEYHHGDDQATVDTLQDYVSKTEKPLEKFKGEIEAVNFEVMDAEQKLDEAEMETDLIKNSYEAREQMITADDDLVERSSRRLGIYAQSELGQAVNARRALYRTYIDTWTKVAKNEEQKAIANLRMNPGWIAKHTNTNFRTGKPLEGSDYEGAMVWARNVEDAVDMMKKHYDTEVFLKSGEANAVAELNKGAQEAILTRLHAQMHNDRIEKAEANISIFTTDIAKLDQDLAALQQAVADNEALQTAIDAYDEITARMNDATGAEKAALQKTLNDQLQLKENANLKDYVGKRRFFTTSKVGKQKLLNLSTADLASNKKQQEEFAQSLWKQSGGMLNLVDPKLRDQIEPHGVDSSGKAASYSVMHARHHPKMTAIKFRKTTDRLAGEGSRAIKERATGYRERMNATDLLSELEGIGIDVHSRSAVELLLEGNVEGAQALLKDRRELMKIVAVMSAAIELASQTRQANNLIRGSLLLKVFPVSFIEYISATLVCDTSFHGSTAFNDQYRDLEQLVVSNQGGSPQARETLASLNSDPGARAVMSAVKAHPYAGRLETMI